MSDKKVLVQNEGFLYNEHIQEGIRKMSFSTNVLEKYDNVVYNASLYMFPFEIEKDIETKSFASPLDFIDNYNKKIIIAQTGLTARFSIDSIILNTTYGGMGSTSDVTTYSAKITLKEQLSCMFSNELEVVSKLIGYNSYIHRPYWLEIWFSGYDPETLMPIEKIPLSNGDDKLIYRGHFGNVKSEMEGNSTTWIIDFFADQNAFINKNINILAISPTTKFDNTLSMKKFLDTEIKNAKKRFINTFPTEELQHKVENLFNEGNPFLDIKILNGDNNYEDISNSIMMESNYNRNIDKESAVENKNDDVSVKFTDLPQWFLSRSVKNKDCYARIQPSTKLIGEVNKKQIYSTLFEIIINKSPLMQKDVENAVTNNGKITAEQTNTLFDSAFNKGTLCKKYVFGFSGQDTSVLEVMNNYDRLWYMNSPKYNIKKQSDSNINILKESATLANKSAGKTDSPDIPKNNSEKKYFGLLEDIYEDIKTDVDANNFNGLEYPEFNNDLDLDTLCGTSNSESKINDAKTLASMNSYKKLFHMGSLSTTKFKIIGDPYWITMISKNYNVGSNANSFLDSIKSKYPSADQYRCVFGVKTFVGQDEGFPYDYSFEYSLNMCGIYKIYKCESIFSEGKFTQTLYGTLDTELIQDQNKED